MGGRWDPKSCARGAVVEVLFYPIIVDPPLLAGGVALVVDLLSIEPC